MTLPAVDTWDVRGTVGPPYTVGPQCSNPNCKRGAEWADKIHEHHVVRRSKIAGDHRWIDVEGEVLPNIAPLCPRCHDDITGRVGGHKAAIRLINHRWHWCLVAELPGTGGVLEFHPVGELDPHPPSLEIAERASTHPVSGMETCPTCGAVKRRRSVRTGTGRRRKTWTVKVPDDAEDGAEILDILVDDLALVLGYDPGPSARYYVLVPALVSAQMNRTRFADEIEGVGG